MAIPITTVSRIWLLAGLILLSGCAIVNPFLFGPVSEETTSNVDQALDEGYIRFMNTTGAHQIVVDGTALGSGDAYSPSELLALPSGTHTVEIMERGSVIFTRKVFIGTGSTHSIALQ